MTGQALRRGFIVLAAVSFTVLTMFLALNIAGWRARLLARLLRVDNHPVIVSPPADFQPQVPSGFKVSIFAKGFDQPRWLAVAPNGDVFVADSGAGQVIVLGGRHRRGRVESRAIFAAHLKLPFG